MKENGVEIVQIPIEQHNLYVEKRNKSEKKKKKIKEKKERKLDDENNNEIERNFQNNNKIYYIIININIKDIIEKILYFMGSTNFFKKLFKIFIWLKANLFE